MSNPLVAQAQSQTTAVTGIGIAESASDLANGVKDGSWVEFGMGALGVGMEALSMVMDPIGTLAQYGASWLIEHVQPLKEALDWLAGDPPVIQSYSDTWANVAKEVGAVAGDLSNEAKNGTAGWTGDGGDAYRQHVAEQTDAIAGASTLADGISTGVMVMGQVVAMVRETVRDLVAELVGKLISWVLEEACTLGFATPLVAVQATTAITNTISKVSDLVRKLIKTIGNVSPKIRKIVDKLGEIIEKLSKLGKKFARRADGATTPSAAHSASKLDGPDVHAPDTPHSPDAPDVPGGTTHGGTGGGDTPSSSTRPGDPKDTKTPAASRRCENDPIDIATGEMVLAQTDLALPGVLPLVLGRTHVSSYRAGRLFGPSWASTVDQRLEFDEQGVVFVAEDGMLLAYPSPPADGSAVLPAFGPRWPLSRTESGFQLNQAEAGRLLEFPATGPVSPISSVADRNGNRVEFGYDGQGTLTEVVHAGYRIAVISEAGRVTELRLADEIGLVRFGYDDQRRLAEVVNSSGRPLKFFYDNAGRIVRWEDRNGHWYRYLYDGAGRCVANQGAGGFLNGTFAYDPDNATTRFTDSLGHTTVYSFDQNRNVVAETDALGRTTSQEWDEYDRLLSRTDPLGRTTRYLRDEHGNIVAATRPDGTQALAEYDDFRLPTVQIDPDGAVWRLSYDERGNLVSSTDPAGATTRYLRDERGCLVGKTDVLGNTTRLEVDAAGLPVAVTDALGATTRYTRDQFGRITSVTDPLGNHSTVSWTVEGKLLARTYPDGTVERWRYDPEGSEIEHVDVLGQVSRTETTHFDLVSASTDSTGATTRYQYDTNLRLVAVTNPAGLTWSYHYDPAGNLVGERDFDGRELHYRLDEAGQVVSRTNGAGQTVHYERDVVGRVIGRRGDDTSASFEFDEAGRLVRAVNASAEVLIRRDVLGRVTAETVNGATMSYRYDGLGRVIGRRTPSGAESRWDYDPAGRPLRLQSGGHTLSFGYDPAGREIERLLDTGAMLAQTWDANNRLLSQTMSTVAGAAPARQARLVQQRRYHYRADNQLSAIEDQLSGVRRFELDPVGRVTAVQGGGWQERYSYDPMGNLVGADWPSAEPAAQGRREYVGTRLRSAGGIEYRHDGQGRIVLRTKKRLSRKPDVWRYQWDAEDRLVAVETPDGTRWRYSYDPLGRRIAKERLQADGSVAERTAFAWDGTNIAEQVHSTGHVVTWDFDGDFRPVTQLERGSLRDAPQHVVDQRFFTIVSDLVGTPTELVDTAGELAWRAQTTVWGEALGRLAHRAYTPLRFPGQYHDPETGLNYNYFRYYDPENGRYDSSDPLGLWPAINPYGYVANPFRSVDPLGLMSCDEAEDALRNLDPNDPANAQARSEAWKKIYEDAEENGLQAERERLARQAGNDIARGRGNVPRELAGGRLDAPQANVPGSQYHVQGPGRGSPGLNLDGTFHDGDPGWNRRTYQWLNERGWAWPVEGPQSGRGPAGGRW
jgi:RHS repeat-associated protein